MPGIVYGLVIAASASLPMAILGILPQAVVTDIAEDDKLTTGQSRQGMFYAARTFSMKFGQSAAMLLFTSMAVLGAEPDTAGYGMGYRLTAFAAAVLCLMGGIVFLHYREQDVLARIGQKGADYEAQSDRVFL